jgi:hypothetical protein
MAAPEYVPTATWAKKHYSSPPQRSGGWTATRPGDTFGQAVQTGSTLGAQGPDQGFALKLVKVFDNKLELAPGEHRSDVDSGCVGVATKRASMYHRAPVVHDLHIAYTLFGFLDETADVKLIEFRKQLFAEVHYSFHYFERRAIADLVTEDVLAQTPDQVATRYRASWRDQLNQ